MPRSLGAEGWDSELFIRFFLGMSSQSTVRLRGVPVSRSLGAEGHDGELFLRFFLCHVEPVHHGAPTCRPRVLFSWRSWDTG